MAVYTKDDIRERVWDALQDSGEARFPFPPHGRIPNVAGADEAAHRLAETPEWRAAATIKSNPDAPQLPVRRAALRAGKTVVVAQPRLRSERPFLRLDPTEVDDVDAATTVSGIDEYGEPVGPAEVGHVDLVVSGSVAVTPAGARIGKGEGYSDLEWAMLAEQGAVDDKTTVATTVHELQVLGSTQVDTDSASAAGMPGDEPGLGIDPDSIPDPDPHDVPMDLIGTPVRVIRTETPIQRPSGIDWALLDADRLAEMPVLASMVPDEE